MFDIGSTASTSTLGRLGKQKGFGWLLGGGTAAVTSLQILIVCFYNWIAVKDGGNIGAFLSSHDGGKGVYQTYCNDDMTKMECGFLFAFQVSAIISILFGGLAAVLFCLPKIPLSSFPSFLAACCSLLQTTFAVMMIVIFGYFKRHYYDDDGVNREYDSPDSDSLYYTTCFYMWIVAICLSFVLTASAYAVLYFKGHEKKDPVLDA